MKRFLAFHLHHFFEWLHQHVALHHYARGRTHQDRATKHGDDANLIRPPEWNPRLWDRDGDSRTDTQKRP